VADTVDDLHVAENHAGGLALHALVVVIAWESGDHHDLATAIEALEARAGRWVNYCRPTCQFKTEGKCQECDPESCGCPCGHRTEG
jgi:hypothetical protein